MKNDIPMLLLMKAFRAGISAARSTENESLEGDVEVKLLDKFMLFIHVEGLE